LGKNPLPISPFTYYYLKIKFVPFLKSQPATIPCKRVSEQDEFLKVSQTGDIADIIFFFQFGNEIVCHYGDFFYN